MAYAWWQVCWDGAGHQAEPIPGADPEGNGPDRAGRGGALSVEGRSFLVLPLQPSRRHVHCRFDRGILTAEHGSFGWQMDLVDFEVDDSVFDLLPAICDHSGDQC